MKLPSTMRHLSEWTFVGPMGPSVPSHLLEYPVIAIDGGAHHTEKMDVWVGDSDSFELDVKASHIFRLPIEKDQSDLAMGLSLFEEPRHYKLHFWGFLGGRKDHELFNIGEALTFLEEHHECQVLMYDESGKITFHLLGTGHWKFSYNGTFSLGTLKKTLVKMKGDCHYPISKYETLNPLSSLGLSNKAYGEVILETEGPVFLYFPEGK